MAATVNLDRCPTCGGTLSIEEQTGRIVCRYCNRYFTYDELKGDISSDMESEDEYDEYSCNDCGGVIVTDTNSITAACPYCGNTSVMKNRVTGKYHPDYIIPFGITPEQAKAQFTQVLHRKMVRRRFQKELQVEEVTSLFVPFWLYNTDISAEIAYDDMQHDQKGNVRKSRKKARFAESYDKVPVDASVKMDDDRMDRIEPYDYSSLKEFDKAYLIGHKAEKYDTDVRLMRDRAVRRIEKSAKTSFSRYLYDRPKSADGVMLKVMGSAAGHVTSKTVQSTMKAMKMADDAANANFDFDSEYIADNTNIGRIRKAKVKADLSDYRYALFPVYLIRGQYRGKNHLYYVNGQTGRIAADFPFSYLKYYLSRMMGTLVGSLFMGVVFYFAAKCFLKLWAQNNDLAQGGPGISGTTLFFIAWAVAFLFSYLLETKSNGKESLREARADVGEVAIVQNAKNFRVPGSFRIIE